MKNEIYLDKKATEIVRKVVGGGGTIKVDELPEVGKEHTIYELTETKHVDGTYNWILEYDSKYGINSIGAKVVETSADLPIDMDSNMYYVRTEDKLGFADAKGGNFIWYDHLLDKDENEIVGVFINLETYIICKEVISIENGNYNVKLLDNTTYTYGDPEIIPFISKLVEVQNAEIMSNIVGFPTIVINNESELPTYQEVIDEGLANEDGFLLYGYATLQGDAWYYGSLNNIEQTIFWDVSEKLDVENEVNFNEPGVFIHEYLFVRQNGGDITETSYWVYSDDEWYNMDELGNNNTCSIFIEFNYGTISPSKMWSAPKLSEIITECNYTITDLENYDYVITGGEDDLYATKSTGIISGLPITSIEDRNFTEIGFKVPDISALSGVIYVDYCEFNDDEITRDKDNNQYNLENYVGGYLKLVAEYQALN